MATTDSEGGLVVVQGLLDASRSADTSAASLPTTRALTTAELVRIDEEEGLDGAMTADANPDAARPHSLAEVLGAVAGLVIVFVGLFLAFPLSHFVQPALSDGPSTYSSAVTGSNKGPLAVLKGRSPSEKVLEQAKKLTAARRLEEALALCQRSVNELPKTREAYREWEDVWAVFLETTRQLKGWVAVRSALRPLGKVNPDSEALAYYRVQVCLDEMMDQLEKGPITESTCKINLEVLRHCEKTCRLRTDGLADRVVDGKTVPRKLSESDQYFILQLSQIYLLRWRLSGRPMTDAGRATFARSLDAVKRLPESVNRARQELHIWEEYLRGLRLWRSWENYSQTIGGESISRSWVDARIRQLREKIGKERTK